jgi:hypothetical protein
LCRRIAQARAIYKPALVDQKEARRHEQDRGHEENVGDNKKLLLKYLVLAEIDDRQAEGIEGNHRLGKSRVTANRKRCPMFCWWRMMQFRDVEEPAMRRLVAATADELTNACGNETDSRESQSSGDIEKHAALTSAFIRITLDFAMGTPYSAVVAFWSPMLWPRVMLIKEP